MRKTDWKQTRDAFRPPSPGRTRPPSAVCVARAGSVWQGLNCLGPTVWELSRASPGWLRWMLPSSSAAVFFPCACLAEHSHVAEGDGRNRALMLPWQTALATWLLEPLFLVSGSSQGSVVPCPGSLALRMTGHHPRPQQPQVKTSAGPPCTTGKTDSWVWHSRPQMHIHPTTHQILCDPLLQEQDNIIFLT